MQTVSRGLLCHESGSVKYHSVMIRCGLTMCGLDLTHPQFLAMLSTTTESMKRPTQTAFVRPCRSAGQVYDVCTAYLLSCTVDMSFVVIQAAQKAAPEKKSKQPAATSAAAGSADTIEQRQKDARKWINDWRAR